MIGIWCTHRIVACNIFTLSAKRVLHWLHQSLSENFVLKIDACTNSAESAYKLNIEGRWLNSCLELDLQYSYFRPLNPSIYPLNMHTLYALQCHVMHNMADYTRQ